MPFPIKQENVERAIRPWLGFTMPKDSVFPAELTERMRGYAPYRQTLLEFRAQLDKYLLTAISRLTHGSMLIYDERLRARRLTLAEFQELLDALMGIVFENLTPFGANFLKLNEYSLSVYSPNAFRVLCQKYRSFYTKEEFAFMEQKIREFYAPDVYEGWF